MSLTRAQIVELAEFQDAQSCAVSFYFQPVAPRNKAHKEDSILIKDLVRDVLHRLENQPHPAKRQKDSVRADMERVLHLSGELRSNGTHAKAVFACAAQDFWREYDLPATLAKTHLAVDRYFHLKPLAQLLGALPRLGVVLVDRHRGVAIRAAGAGGFARSRKMIDPNHAAFILILVAFTGLIGQSRRSGAKDEGHGKSDLRLGEHGRISCSVDLLNLLSAG